MLQERRSQRTATAPIRVTTACSLPMPYYHNQSAGIVIMSFRSTLWLVNGNYSSLKPAATLPEDTLVLFHHTDPYPEEAHPGDHLLLDYGPLAQHLLLLSGSYVPPAVLVVDMRPLLTSGSIEASTPLSEQAMHSVFEEESLDTRALGKKLGKSVGRDLAKLHLQSSTLVAMEGDCAQLLLKLLSSTDSHGLGSAPGRVQRMLFIHPRIPPKCLKTLLKAQSTATQLDLIFASDEAANEMLGELRQSFPTGRHWVDPLGTAAERDAMVCRILCGEEPDVHQALAPLDFELYSDMGCSCWFNSLEIVMNRVSKQAEQILFDVKEELQELCEEEDEEDDLECAEDEDESGFETIPDQVV